MPTFLRSNVSRLDNFQSATAIEVLILAMVLYPKTFQAAREQIDKIVGQDRLPTFHDLNDLSHVHAIAREILRWRPPIPLCKHDISIHQVILLDL